MPVHLLWGMTDDDTDDVSIYEPKTEVEEPIPETDTEELRPTIIPEDEDPCN